MPVGNHSRNGHQTRDAGREKANGEEDTSNSEDESLSFDEEEGDRMKVECLDDMQYLEQQFTDLKELLYQEKVQEIGGKIQLVNEETSPEYLHQVKELDEVLQSRVEMAELQHRCRVENIRNKFDEEQQSANHDFDEMCRVALMQLKADVEEKIRRLEEERVIAELNTESSSRKRKAKALEFVLLEKRKKPVTVTGPCVVHMLRDMEIMEDLNDIKRGRANTEVQRRMAGHVTSRSGWR